VNTYLAQELDDGMPVVVVANKKDKLVDLNSSMECVNFKIAEQSTMDRGLYACIETSAKTGEGIKDVFEKIAKELLHRKGPKSAGRVDHVQHNKGKCC